MPPKPADTATPLKKGPGHFLVRNTGEAVPLIPADELPIGMEVIGVPRSLDLTATVGMLNLGFVRNTGHFYEVEKKDKAKEGATATKSQETKAETTTITKAASSASKIPLVSNSTSCPDSHTTAAATTNTAQASRPRASASSTQTCKHWAAHGICKWGQQCRYRHIMPMTHPGLREAGLSDWPSWYRAMNPDFFHDLVPPQMPPEGSYGHGHLSHRDRGHFHGCTSGCCDPCPRIGGQMVRYDSRPHSYGHAHGARNHGPYATKPTSSPRRFVSAAECRRREEVGEEILERLRMHALTGEMSEKEMGRSQDLIRKARLKEEKKVVNGMLEKAADRNARVWEDESSSSGSDVGACKVERKGASVAVKVVAGKEKGNVVKGKLVDI